MNRTVIPFAPPQRTNSGTVIPFPINGVRFVHQPSPNLAREVGVQAKLHAIRHIVLWGAASWALIAAIWVLA